MTLYSYKLNIFTLVVSLIRLDPEADFFIINCCTGYGNIYIFYIYIYIYIYIHTYNSRYHGKWRSQLRTNANKQLKYLLTTVNYTSTPSSAAA